LHLEVKEGQKLKEYDVPEAAGLFIHQMEKIDINTEFLICMRLKFVLT
jgi:hypothetical protein